MSKKVVWATDGSSNADHALDCARAIGVLADAELTVVHSAEYLLGPRTMGETPLDPNEDEVQDAIRQKVQGLNDDVGSATLRVVQPGAPGTAHVIADVAREVGAELIVVGTRGRSPVVGLLLGGVTQRLLHFAPCPVLAVPSRD